MVRRLGIAQALLGDSKLLIFDEPTAGLDPEERIRFKKIKASLSKDKVVLISTHICSDIEALCDKVMVIDKGKLLYNGTLAGLEEIGSESESNESESALERGYLCLLNKDVEDLA
jgi:ABC-2 type transport system ATP-binding protein